tara:strand:+ start:20 stop:586 length:567 start_codon:yes stop_codon:yes gene_type:complete
MLNRDKVIDLNDFETSEIKITEISHINKINLRINKNNINQMSSCGKILDTILPIIPNTYSRNKKVKVIWLSPDEWLVLNYTAEDICKKLHQKIGDTEASVTDVSENRTVLRVSGKKLFILLSKFLTLDLEKVFSKECSAAQTLFIKVPILLLRNYNNNEQPVFDIFVNRSQTKYIYNLLIDGENNLDF